MAFVQKRSTLKVWGDVIFAIFLREIKSQFNDKLGIAWSVVSPVLFILVLSFARGRLDGGQTHSIPTFIFMVYGMLLITFFIAIVPSISNSISKNKPLFAFRQVQPISGVIALAGFQLLMKIAVYIGIFSVCYFIHLDVKIDNLIRVILIFFEVWLISISIGLVLALASCYVPEVKKLQVLAMRPMFFISGVFFSLQDIPEEYWHYLNWNPFLHAVELTRYAAYPSYGNAGVSYFYLDMFTLCSIFFALACYCIGWKQAISR
ncbi:ABC transporter permease [Psychromonas arctica]|uniref:ABC transporter permease n=1 Tax=Psychromonas arctica TaxID=168275 RepID=UPI002FD36017